MSRLASLLALLAPLAVAAAASGCAADSDDTTEDPATSDESELRRYVEAGRERPEVGYLRYNGSYCRRR